MRNIETIPTYKLQQDSQHMKSNFRSQTLEPSSLESMSSDSSDGSNQPVSIVEENGELNASPMPLVSADPAVIVSVAAQDLSQFLKSHDLFSKAPDSFIEQIERKMHCRHFQPGDLIIREGEPGRAMFFIIRGTVTVGSKDMESVYAELSAEIGVLFDIPRTATVIARTRCFLAVLTMTDFNDMLNMYPEMADEIRLEAECRYNILVRKGKFQKCSFQGPTHAFQYSTESLLVAARNQESSCVYNSGEIIWKEGSWGTELFVIEKGSVVFSSQDESRTYFTLKEGTYFGEENIFALEPLTRSCVVKAAENDCHITTLTREAVCGLLQNDPELESRLRLAAKRTSNLYRLIEDFKMLKKQDSDGSLAAKPSGAKLASQLSISDTSDTSSSDFNLIIPMLSTSLRSQNALRASIANLQPTSIPDERISDDDLSDDEEASSTEDDGEFSNTIIAKMPVVKNHLLNGVAEPRRRASVAVWSDPYLSQFASNQQARATQRTIVALKAFSADDVSSPVDSNEESALEMIFLQLSFKQLWRMRRVSKQWKSVIDSSSKLMRKIDLSQMSAVIDDHAVVCISSVAGINLEILLLKNNWKVTNAAVKSIASSCPNLEVLDLNGCWDVTDESLISLSLGTRCLRSIDLSNCRKVTDHGLESLMTNCRNVMDLFLSYCKALTDGMILNVGSRCANIRRVNLQRCVGISDAGWEEFGKFMHFKLQELILSDCSFLTETAMRSIGISCPNLRSLNLSFCCAMNEEGLRHIATGCTRIKNLDVSFCGAAVTDSSLEVISQRLTVLERLSIRGCVGATNNGISFLINSAKNMKAINLSNCKNVTKQFLEENIPKTWTMLNAQVPLVESVGIDGGGDVYGSGHMRRYTT